MEFLDCCIHPNNGQPDIECASRVAVQLLAHVDLKVCSEDRVGLSVNQGDVFAFKLGNLRNRQICVKLVLSLPLNRIVKQ